ncbi:MAG TPA: PDZ domain-containing protein [Polyangiaceae bacterium]|nr:PDZ domain-containing protein [Polyangiaceae bacterium]
MSITPSALIRTSDFFKMARIYGGLPYLSSLPGSAAERAGLRWGDVVVAINGQPTPDVDSFVQARALREGGATVRFMRDGAELEVELTW